MRKISVLDFWTNYSEGAIHFFMHPELSLRINLNMFFNSYFGRLCFHNFDFDENDHAKLICRNCIHINHILFEHICDSHIGIIKGQLEKISSTKYDTKRIWSDNNCNIVFYAKEK